MFKKKQESTFRALFEAEGDKIIYVSRLIFLLQNPQSQATECSFHDVHSMAVSCNLF